MSIESFIRAMPKVELHVQLEGTVQKDTLMLIAEQNEIPENVKHFQDWVRLLDRPDYARINEIVQVTAQWMQQPEDLTRIVYDLGVSLAKQNVRYAEVSVSPTIYMQSGLTFEEIINALHDGRDKVQRGWGVRMAWVLTVPRDEPRKADDIVRWSTGATGKKAGVVAMGLVGQEDAQPVGQFERAFRVAEKKGLPRVCQAGNVLRAEGILEVIHGLNPDRLVDGWGAADAPDVLNILRDKQIPLNVCIARALCMGWVKTYADYPLRQLYDEGVQLIVSAGMPRLFNTSLTDEYLAIVEHCGFSISELEEVALNAVHASFLPPEDKEALLAEFTQAYAQLRGEHLASEAQT